MEITLKELRHQYPSGETALRGVDATFSGNEAIAIIGQNGAGKSTLVKHLNGLLRPTSGEVQIDGENINDHTTAYWSRKVGYVFQNPDNQLFLETVRKELEFGPKQQGQSKEEIERRLSKILPMIGLEDYLETHPFDLNGADKKFCTIGSVMMMNPEVIIFDEPTCGQDGKGNQRLREIITYLQNQGVLCITITHDMKFVVKNFTRIMLMARGEILAFGTPTEIFSNKLALKKSFVTAPPITRVGQALGFERLVFEKEEFQQTFRQQQKFN